MNTQHGSGLAGKPATRRARVVHHAYPVVPQPHTYGALMTYIRYRYGIILPKFVRPQDYL